jgi:hypothetical protein
MSIRPPRLESSIREYFSPILREEGFRGSGRTFRRVINDLIQIVNIQGSVYGGRFAVNLGVQPEAVSNVLGDVPDPHKITEPECVFRRRLRESDADQWWSHDASKEGMNAAVAQAAQVYIKYGRPVLTRIAEPDSPLNSFTPQDLGKQSLLGFGSTRPVMALALAELRLSQGKTADAKAFAEAGLDCVGSAVLLKTKLKRLLASL